MSRPKKIIVGISGGVDSAVTALLLKQQGYEVQGLHMSNWDEDDSYCTAAEDFQDARRVCADIGIPLHRVSFAKEYREQVFADFLHEYRQGRTPNPDVACNRHIKFGEFLRYAKRLGADRIATGHYARIRATDSGAELLTGKDPDKDQSYFLHAVPATALAQALFPLGELNKAEVRHIANAHGLSNFAKRDSTGICFIGERPFREFLGQYIDSQHGDIETVDGDVLGQHSGLMFYTLGQRQGLEIGGQKGYSAAPWFVAAKDLARNALIVVQGHDHPLLYAEGLTTEAVHWIAGQPPAQDFSCSVRTRYRQKSSRCELHMQTDGSAAVSFKERHWAVTPGQYAVFYADEVCLGGGVIDRVVQSQDALNLLAGDNPGMAAGAG